MKEIIRCPNCKGKLFRGNQNVTMDVIVNGHGDRVRNVKDGITDSERPFGPFTCVKCGTEYNDLPIRINDATLVDMLYKKASEVDLNALNAILDEAVHDLQSARATEINNGGSADQIRFLLNQLGVDKVLALIAEAKPVVKALCLS